MSGQDQIVEHVVLFNMKSDDVDSSKVTAWVNGLNDLTSLDLTIHLSAGKLLRSQSPSLTFTHILHGRYRSKDHLREYTVHPEHIRMVIEGKPFRVGFYKLKESLGEIEKARVLEVIGGIKNELSFGENFSHDRAKGYTIASIAQFADPTELDSHSTPDLLTEEVKDSIESVVVVDYVIPYPYYVRVACSLVLRSFDYMYVYIMLQFLNNKIIFQTLYCNTAELNSVLVVAINFGT